MAFSTAAGAPLGSAVSDNANSNNKRSQNDSKQPAAAAETTMLTKHGPRTAIHSHTATILAIIMKKMEWSCSIRTRAGACIPSFIIKCSSRKGKRSVAAVSTTESCTANVAVESFNQQAFGTTVFILAIDAMDHWKFDSLRIVKKWQNQGVSKLALDLLRLSELGFQEHYTRERQCFESTRSYPPEME
jgi:hypothetical protein